MHFHELQIKEMLNARLAVPIAFLAVVLSGYLYLIDKFKFLFFKFFEEIGVLIFVISIGMSFFYFFKACHIIYKLLEGMDYRYLPYPEEQKNYIDGLFEYYKGGKNIRRKVANEFDEYLCESLNQTIYSNKKVNEFKLGALKNANIYTIKAFIFMIVALLCKIFFNF